MGYPQGMGTQTLIFTTEARRRGGDWVRGIAGDELCKSLFFGDEPGGGRWIVSHPFVKNAKGWATRRLKMGHPVQMHAKRRKMGHPEKQRRVPYQNGAISGWSAEIIEK